MTQNDIVSKLIDELMEKAKVAKIPKDMILAEILYRHYSD